MTLNEETPLHWASRMNQKEILYLLVQHGCDVLYAGKHGPASALSGVPEIKIYLQKKELEVSQRKSMYFVNLIQQLHRQHVIDELIHSEADYCADLDVIVQVFMPHEISLKYRFIYVKNSSNLIDSC